MARKKAKVGKVLFTSEQIDARLAEMAREIDLRYAHSHLTVVAVLKGSLFFLADLVRRLTVPVRMDILDVSSYRDRTKPASPPVLAQYVIDDVRGRDVLVVDDILDTGATLSMVLRRLKEESPRTLAVCVLLDKKPLRKVDVKVDFRGFELKTADFVVGYGLDYQQRFRNLPYLAVLELPAQPVKAKRSKPAAKKAPDVRKPPRGTGSLSRKGRTKRTSR
jgi:hypoxanthine phosphoribosyltransferase